MDTRQTVLLVALALLAAAGIVVGIAGVALFRRTVSPNEPPADEVTPTPEEAEEP